MKTNNHKVLINSPSKAHCRFTSLMHLAAILKVALTNQVIDFDSSRGQRSIHIHNLSGVRSVKKRLLAHCTLRQRGATSSKHMASNICNKALALAVKALFSPPFLTPHSSSFRKRDSNLDHRKSSDRPLFHSPQRSRIRHRKWRYTWEGQIGSLWQALLSKLSGGWKLRMP